MRPEPVRRVAVLGGESSGKTTLVRMLATQLRTAWVPEYGRQRFKELRQTLSADELLRVARKQVSWEDQHAASAQVREEGWLVCDTTPLTTLQYCLFDHGRAPVELQSLARRHYDFTVLCLPDFKFVQDGCRRDDPFRSQQHDWTVARLAAQGVTPVVVSGTVEARLSQVLEHLQGVLADPPRVRAAP